MKSIFLLCSVLAVSDASKCAADELSLLQGQRVVRKTKTVGSKDSRALLTNVRDVANSLLDDSDTTMSTDEVNEALGAAGRALAELTPAIREQVVNAQQQITDASAAVRACHLGEQAEVRASLQRSLGQRAAAVATCHDTLDELRTAEAQQCGTAEDCLCDEARVRTTDQEALCGSTIEIYEVAFCEHHQVCTMLHQCHSNELEVYQSLRADVEAEMALTVQEYIAVEQSRCLTGLIREAMNPPVTPISHAALIACDDVDVSAIRIDFPVLPEEPAACPAPTQGNPPCLQPTDDGCVDGDVKAADSSGTEGDSVSPGTPFFPWVRYQSAWYPVCGHYFWDNHNGANIVCRKLGFTSGTLTRTGAHPFPVDAMVVGRCSESDDSLTSCSLALNRWGDPATLPHSQHCAAGSTAGAMVTCTGPLHPASRSCSSSSCSDGAVRAADHTGRTFADILPETNFYPWVLYQSSWYPVCGHYFWDNHNGANIICQNLGFSAGILTRTGAHPFPVDSMVVGRCSESDDSLASCSLALNRWGDPATLPHAQHCAAGSRAGVMVRCTGGDRRPNPCN